MPHYCLVQVHLELVNGPQSVKVPRPEVQTKELSESTYDIIRQSTNRVLSLNKQANIYSSCVSNCRSNSIQEIFDFKMRFILLLGAVFGAPTIRNYNIKDRFK